MKVYEALAKAFVAEGTTAVFGMMGDANMYWMNELDKLGVALLEVRHEGGGLAMADGYGPHRRHTPAWHDHERPRRQRSSRRRCWSRPGRGLRWWRSSARHPLGDRPTCSASTRSGSPRPARPASSTLHNAGERVRGGAEGVLPGPPGVASDHAERADGRPAEDLRRRRRLRAVDGRCSTTTRRPTRTRRSSRRPPTSSRAAGAR